MSWPYVKLCDVAEIVTGTTPSKKVPEYYGKRFAFITPSELNENEIGSPKIYLSETGAAKARLLPPKSVLVCCIGSLGKVGYARTELTTNQQINSLIFDPKKVYPRFGYFFCKTLKPILEHIAPSTTVAIVNKSRFSELQMPLPSLQEQKHIVDVLEKVEVLRYKRQETIKHSEQLLRSVFLDIFGDPLKNPNHYKVGKIGDLLSTVNYGTSAKAGEKGEYPILRMNNITYEGGWNLESLKYIDMTEKDRVKYTAEPGDILFNRTNSKELVGKTAVFREKKPYIFAGYLIRSKTNSLAEPEYISGYLNSAYGKEILKNMCKSIIGMANINAKEYQNICIPIPPIKEQQKYVRSIEQIRRQIIYYKDSLAMIEELYGSLSKKAFNNDLIKEVG